MEKTDTNFDLWNKDKIIINNLLNADFFVNAREIWYTKMGINIGYEENGKTEFKRPVLVIKKVGTLFLTLALTSKGKNNNKFYHKFKTANFNQKNLKYKEQSYCILSQIKVMDKKRFTEYMGYIGEGEFLEIKEKLKAMLL